MRILKWPMVAFGLLIILFFLWVFQPWVFLPHKHIVISLPFSAKDDPTTSLIPLGEKIEHPDGDGHPGIDFGFGKVTGVLVSFDGEVSKVDKNKDGSINVEIVSGFYRASYKELNTIEPNIKNSAKVKKGQMIGYSGRTYEIRDRPKPGDPSGQVHWEFKSISMFLDRLCPMNYFDIESKQKIAFVGYLHVIVFI